MDDRNWEQDQVFKMVDNGQVSTLRRERTDVQFVDQPILNVGRAPSFVCPMKGCRIDDLGGTVYPLRLKPRGRSREQPTVEPILIQHSRRSFPHFHLIVSLEVLV